MTEEKKDTPQQNNNNDSVSSEVTKLPVPRKGILKRANSLHATHSSVTENVDTLSPLRSDTLPFPPRGFTPPRSNLPADVEARAGTSKIPRTTRSHSVSWWETSSACGERSARSGSVCSDDETASIGSSSSIAGTWWFGKTTRYVPHCQRRHLKHGDDPHNYKTPTQKKNKQIHELKKQLALASEGSEDKEKHLVQLRERMGELESLLEGDGGLAESAKLKVQLKLMEDKHTEESEIIKKESSLQIRRLSKQLLQYKQINQTNVHDSHDSVFNGIDVNCGDSPKVSKQRLNNFSQTEDSQMENQELESSRMECAALINRVDQLESSLKEVDKELNDPQGETCGSRVCMANRNKLNAFVQAHQNECLVWRTKAAELEMNLRKYQQTAALALQDKLNAPPVINALPGTLSPTNSMGDYSQSLTSASGDPQQEIMRLQLLITDLQRQQHGATHDRRTSTRTLSPNFDEPSLDNILSERDTTKSKSKVLESKLSITNQELMDKSKELKSLEGVVAELERRLSASSTETSAAKLALGRLRNENETLQREITEQDDRLRMMHNAMLEHGLVAQLHNSKRMVTAHHAAVYKSQVQQTDITCERLDNMTADTTQLRDQLEKSCMARENETSDLRLRLGEVTDNLNLKTQVINTLTHQLNTLQNDMEIVRDNMEVERKVYSHRLEEVSTVASRVPLLQMELESNTADLQQAHFQLNVEKDQYQQSISDNLYEGIASQKSSEERWQEKVELLNQQIQTDRIQMDKLNKQLNLTSITLNMEKAELGHKLEESYSEINKLTQVVYRPHEDKEVWVFPETRDKLTACFPITQAINTQIESGDFVDLMDEKIKLMQGELCTTQKQVTVLQDKLLGAKDVETNLEDISAQKRALENILMAMKTELALVKGVWHSEKDDLDARVERVEFEKEMMERNEQNNIEHLETEFDSVKDELDLILTEYEYERQKMVGREKQIEELHKERQHIVLGLQENERLRDRLAQFENIMQTDCCTETVEISMRDACTTVPLKDLQAHTIDIQQQTEVMGVHVASQANIANPKLVQSLRLLHVAQLANIPEEGDTSSLVDLSGLEKKIEELAEMTTEYEGIQEGILSPVSSTATPRRRKDAASEYLLKRLNEERAKYTEIKEQLETDVKKLEEELNEAKNELANRSESVSIRSASFQRSLSSFSLVRSKSIPNIVVTMDGEISVATDATGSVVALTDEHSAQLRAKNICLMKQNHQLVKEFTMLRQSVGNLIERHEPKSIVHKDIPMAEDDLDSILKSFEMFEKDLNHETPSKSQEESAPIKSWPSPPVMQNSCRSELATDLLNVRHDLEGILRQIDDASPLKPSNVSCIQQKEGAFVSWLEKEIQDEKRELDVIVKWYEQDKKRMQKELTQLKEEQGNLQCELDRIDLEHHDMGKELEFYRMEDLRKSMEDKKIKERGQLVRAMSDGELYLPRDGSGMMKWKWKAGAMFRDMCKLRRNYVHAEEDRRLKGQHIIIMKGEIEVLTAELQTYRERASEWEKLKEAEALADKEMHTMQNMDNALQAVIDNNEHIVNMWGPRDGSRNPTMSAISLPNSPEKSSKEKKLQELKSNLKKPEKKVVLTASKTELETIKQLHNVEIKRARVQIEDLKLEGKKYNKIMDKIKEEKEQMHETIQELKASFIQSQHEIVQLKSRLDDNKNEYEAIRNDSEYKDIQQKFMPSLINLMKIIELNHNAKDLLEDNEKIKDCVSKLEQVLSNLKQGLSPISSRDSTPTLRTAIQSLNTGSIGFHTPQSDSNFTSLDDISSLNFAQCSKTSLNSTSEDRELSTERELKMVQEELKMYRKTQQTDIISLKNENHDLKQKLEEANDKLKKMEAGLNTNADVSAQETIRDLQSKVSHLQEEMLKKECEHQSMYLQMFQKGQDTAKAEILGDNIDPQDRATVCTIPLPNDLWESVASARGKEGLTKEEVVLRFLRDSVYYFLKNPNDAKDHLQAIMSLLKFSEQQRQDIIKKKNLHLQFNR